MYPHPNAGQGQLPPASHWAPQPQIHHQPAHTAYPPPPSHINTSLPPQPQEPRPDMSTLPPQQAYRLPALPHDMYRGGPPPQDMYRGQPPHMAYPQHQPAPRQRTAIACRYCRRRKIRCSGFENQDGRCTNCVRFSQECLFTPVSAQAQAFVPAQTAWRNGQTPPLYGAYGQPLPPQHHQDPYAPRQPGYALPSPSGPYPAPGSAYPPGPYDDRSSHDATSRKRPANEPHTPTLPPPNPATASQLSGHRGSGAESSPYTYPDPTALTPAAVSPASSNASYHSSVPPHSQPQQPYYAPQPAAPRRSSPQSTYSYDPGRASSSPNTQAAPTTPGQAGYGYGGVGPDGLRPPQGGPTGHNDGRTPPPTSQGGSRPGMRITDIVDGGSGGGRSAADSDMLKALNRRPM